MIDRRNYGHISHQKKWTKDQIICLKVIYYHFGDDIGEIKKIMDDLFYPSYFTFYKIKDYLSKFTDALMRDFGMFTTEEFVRVYDILKIGVNEQFSMIDIKDLVYDEFPVKRRIQISIAANFQTILHQITTYTFEESKPFEKYTASVADIGFRTFYIVLYLARYPSKETVIIEEFCRWSKFIVKLFDYWIENGFCHHRRYSQYDNMVDYCYEMPQINPQDLMQALEVMSLINSLLKIRFYKLSKDQIKERKYPTNKKGKQQRQFLYGVMDDDRDYNALVNSNESMQVFSVWMQFDKHRTKDQIRFQKKFS